MEKELLKELNKIRKELGIPEEDYLKIMALAKMHAKRSKVKISDEMVYEIVLEALSSYDYNDNINEQYSPIEAKRLFDEIKPLIENETERRYISDKQLSYLIEDYLSAIDSKDNKKNLEEVVMRATKSLDF